ncbi:MAG: glutamine--fructose-6-phosphate transaminase (isomerizing) [Candidatus Omnitrophica bacterium]|nr:glutamine--fructose-6-phosphate transaminase (isomerizing) [Candidatus Omnitrophota bacterium]
MCGIVGYVGEDRALPILINGLKRLEYRGYDSAGVSFIQDSALKVLKKKGRIQELEKIISKNYSSSIGIAHTRWATHGEPSDANAHPLLDCKGRIAVVHNGIIENYSALRKYLTEKGHRFVSATDTEVISHLIEEFFKGNLAAAVRRALLKLEGAYGVAVLSQMSPGELICAKNGSPLILGKGKRGYFVASDPTAIVEHTRSVIYLKDGEIAVLRKDKCGISTLRAKRIEPKIDKITFKLEQIEKGGFKNFMLKEIYEQPQTITEAIRGRINVREGGVRLGGLIDCYDKLAGCKRIILTGCGTSWHACLFGKYVIEELAGVMVDAAYASEFRYRNPVLYKDDVLIAVSQSGETADTLAAIREAKLKGVTTLGICNVVGSTIARETEAGVYTHAGPEIGVASTKAFTSQTAVIMLLAVLIGRIKKRIGPAQARAILKELSGLPVKVKGQLARANEVKKIARKFFKKENFLYLGRGVNYPIALEGALKLKEISYIHAEGCPAAEMKHGPIALIDEDMPVVFIAPRDKLFRKIVSNMEEIKSRNGIIIAVSDKEDELLKRIAAYVIHIPSSSEFLMPILATIPLQLLAYYIAEFRGCNVDKPRHLAKSVTVE